MKKKLGEILIAAGAVSRADIEAALSDQSAGEPARLGDLLVALGKITPLQLAKALSIQYGVRFTTVPAISREVLDAVPMDLQRRFRFIPLKVAQGSITIALADLSHASSDVLPVLRKRWGTVNLFVAPSDEIEAAHAQAAAPPPAPSRRASGPLPRKPVVTASDDELFAALDLALPSDPAPAAPPSPPPEEEAGGVEILSGLSPLPSPGPQLESYELEVPQPDEEEVLFFEAAPAALLTTDLPDSGPRADAEDALATLADPFEAPLMPLEFEVSVTGSDLGAVSPAPAPPPGDDQPFFETAPQAVPIASLEDEAFVPDVPMSSGSSLAALVIQPDAAPLAAVPPVDLPRPRPVLPPPAPPPPPPPRSSQPGSFTRKPSTPTLPVHVSSLTPIPAPEPVAPRRQGPVGDLPDWLKAAAEGAPGEARWTGALEDLAPSKLVTAVAKALIRRGVLTEQDILDAVPPRKR
jgi:hypothetical protein